MFTIEDLDVTKITAALVASTTEADVDQSEETATATKGDQDLLVIEDGDFYEILQNEGSGRLEPEASNTLVRPSGRSFGSR